MKSLRGLVTISLILMNLMGCKGGNEPLQGEGDIVYPPLSHITDIVQEGATRTPPDAMASILYENLDALQELAYQNYPVIVFWVRPQGIPNSIRVEERNNRMESLDEESLKFAQRHIVPERIQDIEMESPPISRRVFKNLLNEDIVIESVYSSRLDRNIYHANGIPVENCYFVEGNISEGGSNELGTICYVSQALF